MTNLDEEIKAGIKGRLEEIESQKEKIQRILRENPEFAQEYLAKDKKATIDGFDALGPMLEALNSEIKGVKNHVKSFTGQDVGTACYMLFGKILKNLRACDVLARGGYYQEFMELARSISESLDLTQLFLIEGNGGRNLPKWFEGEIIDNGTARKIIGEDFDKRKEVAMKDIKIDLGDYEKAKVKNHRLLSKFNHSSYAALLDSYDRVNEDLDFDGLAGYHFLKEIGVPQFKLMIEHSFVVLKQFFFSIGDDASFKSAEKRLDSFSDIASPERIAQAKQVIEEFSKKNKGL
jgi:hypothetical protein